MPQRLKDRRPCTAPFEDLPVTLVKSKTTLILRQIVLYVDKETIELVKKHRRVNQREVIDSVEQVYLDNSSICFILEPKR